MYAVHGGVTKALWEGTTDQDVLGIASIANTIIDNLNVFSGGPVWSAITDVGKNRNWYGSRITPTRMDSWESSTRYSEDTPDLFIGASRVGNWALDKVGATDDTKNMISPLNLQYLAEQYTGYIGQMVIPALKKNKYTGENQSAQEMVMSAITAAQKRLTTDPLISNEVVSAFYDGSTFITQVSTAAKNNRPLNLLKSGLTPEQASEAANEAKALTSKGGILYETKSIINDLYTQIDNINGNDTLSNEEKYTQTSQVRREMIKTALYANEAIEAYRQKWVTGEDISLRAFEEGAYGTIAAKDTTVTLSDTFKNDADQRYMQMAQDVYNATGKAYALPHPKYTVTIDHKDYEVDESFRANFDKIYKEAYNKYLVKIRNWADLNYDERLRVMKGAHDSAQSKATNEYYDQVLKFMGVKKSK